MAPAPGGVLAAGSFMSYPTSFPPNISLNPLNYYSPFVGKIGLVMGQPEETARAGRATVYPNPVRIGQEVRLAFGTAARVVVAVTWLDATGRVARTEAVGANGMLSTTGLAPGVYVAWIAGAGGRRLFTTRLVVLP